MEENLKVYGTRSRDRLTDATHLAEVLQEQERKKKLDGICQVWNFWKRHDFDLPTEETPEAEFLWGTFAKDHVVVEELLEYAVDLRKRTGRVYSRLYEVCMARWLPDSKDHRRALSYHRIIRRELQQEKLPLRHIARICKGRLDKAMYDTLLDMYQDSNEADLYDQVVPELYHLPDRAMRWHTACILKGDVPSPEVATSSALQTLLKRNAAFSEDGVPEQHQEIDPQMDQDLLRRMRGRDSAPVRFEDSFSARMFATKALTPDAVIKGLALVGVNEVGPLTIRTMASRTDPITDLPARFEELRAAGIALQGCVFSLALEKFAKEEQFSLVRSMLESDLHPDVYGDAELQMKLLDYYIKHEDWQQVHRTLAVSTLFYLDHASHAWNTLLQAHITACVPEAIFHALKTMAQHHIIVSSVTLNMLRRHVLRPRRKTRRPISRTDDRLRGFDDLRFVAQMYMFILEHRMADIPPTMWHEIMRRFGMTSRMRELRRLVHWLFCWYAPRGSMPLSQMRKPGFLEPATERLRLSNPTHREVWRPLTTIGQTHKDHPLRQLFPDRLQQALIIWGARAGLLPDAPLEQSLLSGPVAKKHHRRALKRQGVLKRLDWDIGLKTLAELRQMRLYVNSTTAIKALQMLFVNLFGHGHSRIRSNRTMERMNTRSYAEYVSRVNEIWDKPLFPEPRMYTRSRLHSLMWHPRFDRVIRRKGHLRLSEIAAGSERPGAQRGADSAEQNPGIEFYAVQSRGRAGGRKR